MDYSSVLNNKNILITGGTGSFGHQMILELMPYKPKLIRIFSRDEDKQHSLKQELSSLSKVKEENFHLKEKLKDDEDSSKEEKIPIDVTKIKRILFTRLKDYHEKHIDDLIVQYDLNKKKEIDKSVMEKILLEAIHV